MATVLGGRLGLVESIGLVFWIQRDDVQGPEEAGK
jgi:hypothetical protein